MTNGKKNLTRLLVLALLVGLLAGCGAGAPAGSAAGTPAVTQAPTMRLSPELLDGVYGVEASMEFPLFTPDRTELTVKNGAMTLTLYGGPLPPLYAGTAEAAAENGPTEGEAAFSLPLEALDEPAALSVYVEKKGAWFDVGVSVPASSLPAEAFAGGLVTAASLGLADGEYTAALTLSGGSGKAKVKSPARVTVESGALTLEVAWGSSNYDYMVVDGVRYEPETTQGGSLYRIPFPCFDREVAVQADTTAMSTPHLIDYTLRLDSATLQKTEE